MSQTTPPPAAAIRKLRIGATFVEAYSLVFSQLGLVIKAAAIPYMITMVLAVASLRAQADPNLWRIAPLVILGFLPYTLFGVSWHRLTLLGPRVSPPRAALSWNRRHWRFIGYCYAITAIGYALIFGASLLIALLTLPLVGSDASTDWTSMRVIVMFVNMLAGGIGFLYLMMRYSFVFPAVAVDEAYGLGNTWNHTRGQGFRLMGLMILTSLPMVVVAWILGLILGLLLTDGVNMMTGTMMEGFVEANFIPLLIFHAITNLPNYLLMAVIVSSISIAFRNCTGWVPAGGGAAPGIEPKPG